MCCRSSQAFWTAFSICNTMLADASYSETQVTVAHYRTRWAPLPSQLQVGGERIRVIVASKVPYSSLQLSAELVLIFEKLGPIAECMRGSIIGPMVTPSMAVYEHMATESVNLKGWPISKPWFRSQDVTLLACFCLFRVVDGK